MNAVLKYGVQTINISRSFSPTIGELISDPNAKSVLGYSDNVRVLINGVEQNLTTVCPDGVTLVIENRANSKA